MKRYELEEKEIKVLETLAEHGAMSPGQVSAQTWMLPGETQTVLRGLSEEGLVLLRDDTQSVDGRLVAMTMKARELMQTRPFLSKRR